MLLMNAVEDDKAREVQWTLFRNFSRSQMLFSRQIFDIPAVIASNNIDLKYINHYLGYLSKEFGNSKQNSNTPLNYSRKRRFYKKNQKKPKNIETVFFFVGFNIKHEDKNIPSFAFTSAKSLKSSIKIELSNTLSQ